MKAFILGRKHLMYKGLNPKLSARNYHNLQEQVARNKAILQHQIFKPVS